jgi:hypothetical protein
VRSVIDVSPPPGWDPVPGSTGLPSGFDPGHPAASQTTGEFGVDWFSGPLVADWPFVASPGLAPAGPLACASCPA